MPLRFLLDEHIRRTVWTSVVRHNLVGRDAIDVIRVGSFDAPPYGTLDPDLLLWTERGDRILLTGVLHETWKLRNFRISCGNILGTRHFMRPATSLIMQDIRNVSNDADNYASGCGNSGSRRSRLPWNASKSLSRNDREKGPANR